MGLIERIKSEYAYLKGALTVLRKVTSIAKNPDRTYPDVADSLAAEFGDRIALLSDDESLTFDEYNRRANQYARWAIEHGISKGDVVTLMMPNRPEYLAVWLGIIRAGGVTALLNTNLNGPALAHCVNIVKPKHVIVDATLIDSFKTAEPHLDQGPDFWSHGESPPGWHSLFAAVDRQPSDPITAADRPKLTTNDKCLYIYTSGTTGLPKAANINHYRVQSIMFGFQAAMGMQKEDRIYICLPLYHTSGGVLAAGAALTAGASIFVREKFSASQFWNDIVDNECTVFQYIGELCRYLLNSPTHPKETTHRLRLASGNGLRPDIWEDFSTRFRIPRILEWYAATEGNAVFLNFDGKVGAVGRIPKWAERKFVTEVVKFDIDTEEPIRNSSGFCIKAAPNEVGEVISQILNDPSRPSQRFEGYADEAATKKKILEDVFEKGDRWFRSGDLMRKDELGYFYFVDRIGDTFRWKGENVATSEVSEAVTVFPGVKEANVYGVKVGTLDGRAGMAALVVDDGFDIDGLHKHVKQQLPAYARPLFIRLQPEMEVTGTFKQRKVDLVKEGFDPAGIADPVYFDSPEAGSYVRLTADLFERINNGVMRL
jgi:fatty-acyl-CoA synthase